MKTPKIYFTDTGLLCYLLGIYNEQTLAIHPLRGEIFENLIFIELLKHFSNKGMAQDVSFWRDNHKTEIDFILEVHSGYTAIESKSGMNFHASYTNNLRKYKTYNPAPTSLFLVYDGDLDRSQDEIQIVNWRKMMKRVFNTDQGSE